MSDYNYFELHRLIDDLIYQFDRKQRANGEVGYQRRDRDLWIVRKPKLGWVAFDEESQELRGRLWNVLPQDQADHPPAGEWVSKKGPKSYVYELVYSSPPEPSDS